MVFINYLLKIKKARALTLAFLDKLSQNNKPT